VRERDATVEFAQTGVSDLQARKLGNVIGLRNPGVGNQGVRIHQRRAPAFEADRGLSSAITSRRSESTSWAASASRSSRSRQREPSRSVAMSKQ